MRDICPCCIDVIPSTHILGVSRSPDAAIKLQAAYRGHRGRGEWRGAHRTWKRESRAARMIQKARKTVGSGQTSALYNKK